MKNNLRNAKIVAGQSQTGGSEVVATRICESWFFDYRRVRSRRAPRREAAATQRAITRQIDDPI
jgi:hypothetical protein